MDFLLAILDTPQLGLGCREVSFASSIQYLTNVGRGRNKFECHFCPSPPLKHLRIYAGNFWVPFYPSAENFVARLCGQSLGAILPSTPSQTSENLCGQFLGAILPFC